MAEHEDVGYHLDQAQALLEFAQPETPAEKLIAAQTHATIGLLLFLRDKPAPDISPVADQVPVTVLKTFLTRDPSMKAERMADIMREAQSRVGSALWTDKLIQMIKEVRALTHLGLKEAKDVVDASKDYRLTHGKDWWT